MTNLYDVAETVIQSHFPDCDLLPTIGGRFQRHPRNLVGNVFRIVNPGSVEVGNCFMDGRLKKGDLWLCTGHSGDCFQNYIYVEKYATLHADVCFKSRPEFNFGSYGIGDSELVAELTLYELDTLKIGGRVERKRG